MEENEKRLRAEVEQLQAERDDATSELAWARAALDAARHLRRQVDSLRAERDEAKEHARLAKMIAARVQAERDEARAERDELRAEVERLEAERLAAR